MSDCIDLMFHQGCGHAGWHVAKKLEIAGVNGGRAAATHAKKGLRLPLIRLRFFEPGPPFSWVPDMDKELIVLNAGPFDPSLMGKIIDPDITTMPTIWVRSGLSEIQTAAVVLHEARHLWQAKKWRGRSVAGEEEEADAEKYAWSALVAMGFALEDVKQAYVELHREDTT